MCSSSQEQRSRPTNRLPDIFRCQHLHPWSWWWTPNMERAAKLSVKAFPGELCGAERDWFSVRLQKEKKKQFDRLSDACQNTSEEDTTSFVRHQRKLALNFCGMRLFCWDSLLSQQNARHWRSKTHPPTNDSWRRSDGRASSAWFVTQLLFAWQRTDTLSELSRNQLWDASTNASETLLNTSQDTYNFPSHRLTTTCSGKWVIWLQHNTFSWLCVWM